MNENRQPSDREQPGGDGEAFLPVTDLPPDFIDRWLLAVPRKTIRLKLVFRDGRLFLAVGGLPRSRHEELERWLACRKKEILCG